MTYEELVKKLNEKYNTDIFYYDYSGNVPADNYCYINLRLSGLEKANVKVKVETLELSDFTCFNAINGESLVKIKEATDCFEQFKNRNKVISNLIREKGELKKELEYLKGIRDFSQETILKAIKEK